MGRSDPTDSVAPSGFDRTQQRAFDEATALNREARELYSALGDTERVAGTHLFLAGIFILDGRPGEAIEPASLGERLLREVGSDTVLASTWLALARAESGDVAGGVRDVRAAIGMLPRVGRPTLERFCVYVADFARRGELYEQAAELMGVGVDQHTPAYAGLLSDVVTKRLTAVLDERLPDWREVATTWRDRPDTDVAELIRSTLDTLSPPSTEL